MGYENGVWGVHAAPAKSDLAQQEFHHSDRVFWHAAAYLGLALSTVCVERCLVYLISLTGMHMFHR